MNDRRRFTGTCPTRHHVILAYLWEEYPRWVPAPELIKLELPYGITGSSGDVRARELARGECQQSLQGKVDRAEGREIGLDKRFTYFRYKQGVSKGARRDSDSTQTVLDQRSTGAVTFPPPEPDDILRQ